jgi:hypothetical protein
MTKNEWTVSRSIGQLHLFLDAGKTLGGPSSRLPCASKIECARLLVLSFTYGPAKIGEFRRMNKVEIKIQTHGAHCSGTKSTSRSASLRSAFSLFLPHHPLQIIEPSCQNAYEILSTEFSSFSTFFRLCYSPSPQSSDYQTYQLGRSNQGNGIYRHLTILSLIILFLEDGLGVS